MTTARVSARSRTRQLLPALMAVGGTCGLMATPATALELGEMQIQSSLGQPLRASVAYALNPHEQLHEFCIYLRPRIAASGPPSLTRATVTVGDGSILLTGNRPISEPLMALQVAIDCPYTAQLSREYTLMINPAQRITEVATTTQPTISRFEIVDAVQPPTPTARPEPRAESQTRADRSPIFESGRYLVQRGDSVSAIAARIPNRPIALWPAVERIIAANPHAFVNGDVNRLEVGTWLEIPDLSVPGVEPAATMSFASAPVESVAESGGTTADSGWEVADEIEFSTTAAEVAPQAEEPVEVADEAAIPEEVASPSPAAGESEYADLQPGDVVVGGENPFVSPIGPIFDSGIDEDLVFSDEDVLQPAASREIPVVRIDPEASASGGSSGVWSWLLWLAGAGLVIITGLHLFGRSIRKRFGSMAVGAPIDPKIDRRRGDGDTQINEAIADIDFEVPDDLPDSTPVALDADFDDGSGLQDSDDIDVAQDFGFSASTAFDEQLDMVIPESAAEDYESGPTDVIPPPDREDEASIVASEMPFSDDSQYDLSMIVDVTKDSIVQADATAKDLQAVQLEATDELQAEEYTVDEEVDFRILEQDYEDELSATQALNAEIEKVAAELAERMDEDLTNEITTAMPRNALAENDDLSDADDTGINEELTVEMPSTYEDATVEMPSTYDDATVEMPSTDDDATVEMPPRDDEATAEMEIESGKANTKKKKKAS